MRCLLIVSRDDLRVPHDGSEGVSPEGWLKGYSPTAGEALVRPELMEEAQRLGRILAELLPREAEVHGLVSLMELQASRTRARISPSGDQVLLCDQDRTRWDWVLVGRGLAALE